MIGAGAMLSRKIGDELIMRITTKPAPFLALALFVAFAPATAAELPGSFPGDIPIADYMVVVNVTQVRDSMMIDLHAPGQTLADVVEWFKSGLAAEGWKSDGESISERQAILPHSKNGRKCGVMVTNFVLNSSMQMDESTKGISLQISGAAAAAEESAEAASEMTGDAAQ